MSKKGKGFSRRNIKTGIVIKKDIFKLQSLIRLNNGYLPSPEQLSKITSLFFIERIKDIHDLRPNI